MAAIALCCASAAHATPLPRCAAHIELSGARIVRVEKNAVLVISDGRAVDVEGLLLPRGRRDHAPASLADRALAAMRAMARGRRATLVVERPKEDRYGRLRAQVFFPDAPSDNWLQTALLRRGLARVNIMPDRPQCADALYAAERQARAAKRGIWAVDAYAVRSPADLAHDIGTFQIVEGDVVSAGVHGGRAYINFGLDWRSDFTATVAPDDMKTFRAAGFDLRTLGGRHVRVRGWIQSHNGPEMELATPEAIEVLGAAMAQTKRPG